MHNCGMHDDYAPFKCLGDKPLPAQPYIAGPHIGKILVGIVLAACAVGAFLRFYL